MKSVQFFSLTGKNSGFQKVKWFFQGMELISGKDKIRKVSLLTSARENSPIRCDASHVQINMTQQQNSHELKTFR